jgi:hypothetical protein
MSTKAFLGTWKLLSFKLINKDQTFIYPYGEKAIGYLTYTKLNHMSVHIMRSDRINCLSNDPRYITNQEKEEIAISYNGYCGKYLVESNNNTIFHYPEISSFPNGCTTALERRYEFRNNKLILIGIILEGKSYPHIVWEHT